MADATEFDRNDDEQRDGEYREDAAGTEDTDTAVKNSAEPDVLLDVPDLQVDEINLEVEDLRAKVSLQAEVLDLVKLNVGADVHLGKVALEIKGVEAQALLKVRLDNVAGILERVLKTIDRNPQILQNLTQGLGTAAREVGEGAGSAVREVGSSAGRAAESVGEGARSATEDFAEGAGSAVSDVGEGAESATESVGAETGKVAAEVGDTARAASGSTTRDAGPSEGRATDRKKKTDTGQRSPRSRSPGRERPR